MNCLCQQNFYLKNNDREGIAAYSGAVEVIVLDDSAIYHTIPASKLSSANVCGYPQTHATQNKDK